MNIKINHSDGPLCTPTSCHNRPWTYFPPPVNNKSPTSARFLQQSHKKHDCLMKYCNNDKLLCDFIAITITAILIRYNANSEAAFFCDYVAFTSFMQNGEWCKFCIFHHLSMYVQCFLESSAQLGSINHIVIRNTVMSGEARLYIPHSIKCSLICFGWHIGKCNGH